MTRLMREAGVIAAAAAAALVVRLLLVSVFLIPSGSMLPGLMPGDFVAVVKWPYGRLPRLLARSAADALPRRGQILVFRGAAPEHRVFVKRLIGLPGDRVALRHGILLLNGAIVPRWRVADLVLPVTPAIPCAVVPNARLRLEIAADGQRACRYPRTREMLPDGTAYDTLDLGYSAGDDFGPLTVPRGRLFLLGDDRDRSADSRLAPGEGGTGLVRSADLVGRVGLILFSTDGSARPLAPLSWFRAIRLDRIGRTL